MNPQIFLNVAARYAAQGYRFDLDDAIDIYLDAAKCGRGWVGMKGKCKRSKAVKQMSLADKKAWRQEMMSANTKEERAELAASIRREKGLNKKQEQELTPRQVAARKAAATRKAKKEAAAKAEVEQAAPPTETKPKRGRKAKPKGEQIPPKPEPKPEKPKAEAKPVKPKGEKIPPKDRAGGNPLRGENLAQTRIESIVEKAMKSNPEALRPGGALHANDGTLMKNYIAAYRAQGDTDMTAKGFEARGHANIAADGLAKRYAGLGDSPGDQAYKSALELPIGSADNKSSYLDRVERLSEVANGKGSITPESLYANLKESQDAPPGHPGRTAGVEYAASIYDKMSDDQKDEFSQSVGDTFKIHPTAETKSAKSMMADVNKRRQRIQAEMDRQMEEELKRSEGGDDDTDLDLDFDKLFDSRDRIPPRRRAML